jgi:hypothetical protein
LVSFIHECLYYFGTTGRLSSLKCFSYLFWSEVTELSAISDFRSCSFGIYGLKAAETQDRVIKGVVDMKTFVVQSGATYFMEKGI